MSIIIRATETATPRWGTEERNKEIARHKTGKNPSYEPSIYARHLWFEKYKSVVETPKKVLKTPELNLQKKASDEELTEEASDEELTEEASDEELPGEAPVNPQGKSQGISQFAELKSY